MNDFEIGYVSLRVPVEVPQGRKTIKAEASFQIGDSACAVWTNYGPHGGLCAEYFGYTEAPGISARKRSEMPALVPHFDQVHRYVINRYAAHRNDLLGRFISPFVDAVDAAWVKREGSQVYFIAAGQRIKIGWSKKIKTRMAQLQTGNPDPVQLLATMPGGRTVERQLHARFAAERLSGEWFRATNALTAYVETIRNGSQVNGGGRTETTGTSRQPRRAQGN